MQGIAADKFALRKTMLAARALVSDEQRRVAGDALARQAQMIADLAGGRVISGFCPFRDEIDTMPLLHALAALGQTLALPRVDGPHLIFHAWTPGDPLVVGRYGMPEPEAGTEVVQPRVLLVPLLAFDRAGSRIGYGAGFFDRVLADNPQSQTVGLAFGMQEVAQVPTEPHDQPLQFVLTEAELIDCRAGSRD